MTALNIKHLTFAYDRDIVLDDISMTVSDNDFLAIIGPNGGGKSTLLKIILGILAPQKGTIEVLGDKPKKSLALIGYVPQNTNVNIDFPIKVLDVVMMGYGKRERLFGYSPNEINLAHLALEKVGMSSYENVKIGSLSGGQRQRIMIARALISDTKILLLDEPTSSIDAKGQKEIYQLLKILNKDIPIVVVSHDISIILEYASKVAHVNKILSFHDISDRDKIFHAHTGDEHFCEVELLQMLGAKACNQCKEEEEK